MKGVPDIGVIINDKYLFLFIILQSVYRQLQVLLGLYKSYKPECVPEDVPAISIHTAFKKINANLLDRFKRHQV